MDLFLAPDTLRYARELSHALVAYSNDQVDLKRIFDRGEEPSPERYHQSSEAARRASLAAENLARDLHSYVAIPLTSRRRR